MEGEAHPFGDGRKDLPCVTVDAHVHVDDLVYLTWIDVDMDLAGLGGIVGYPAGDPVVEAHSHRDQEVAALRHHIWGDVAVHAGHSDIIREVGRQGAEAQERAGGGDAALLEEGLELLLGVRKDDALAEDHERAFGFVDEAHGLVYRGGIRGRHGHVTADEIAFAELVFSGTDLGGLGEIQHDRTRTAGGSDMEGLGDGFSHLGGLLDLIDPLGDRRRHSHEIGLLESVRTQLGGADLAGDDHDGGRVYHRVGDAGDDVGGTRTGGHHHDSRTRRRPRIALCGMHGALLVADQYVIQSVGV